MKLSNRFGEHNGNHYSILSSDNETCYFYKSIEKNCWSYDYGFISFLGLVKDIVNNKNRND